MKTGGGKKTKKLDKDFQVLENRQCRTDIPRGGTTNEERCITTPQLTPREGF